MVKTKSLINLKTDPNIKVSGAHEVKYGLLNKRLKYLQKLLFGFKIKVISMLNKERDFLQYNSGHLLYIISLQTSQLRTLFRKVLVKYVGPVVIYKIVDPKSFLVCTFYGRLLLGLFEHEILKQVVTSSSQRNWLHHLN